VILKDRVAIVTGGARGIGQEYCMAMAREGAKIVAADLLSCEQTVTRVREEAGGEAIGVRTDVSDAASTQAMAQEALRRFGRIDVLVNNAAYFAELRPTPFDQLTEEQWDRAMTVNVKGVWLCCKAVIPAMKHQGKGRIINISSGTIWWGAPLVLHYVTSKGAVWALTRALARELADTGINVNTVTPGYTDTEATRINMGSIENAQRMNQRMAEARIIKRAEQASDLAGTVVFLASDAADFISGQTINCDGGNFLH
jgi:3-oxoacyl-[acyl-carrier protein] reductase